MPKQFFRFYKIYKYESWHDQKCISKIIFPIHWDRSIIETISFNDKVTLGYALHTVETFLSQKVTKKYINTYPQLQKYTDNDIKLRGDLLGGYFWLQTIELGPNNVLTLDLCN